MTEYKKEEPKSFKGLSRNDEWKLENYLAHIIEEASKLEDGYECYKNIDESFSPERIIHCVRQVWDLIGEMQQQIDEHHNYYLNKEHGANNK